MNEVRKKTNNITLFFAQERGLEAPGGQEDDVESASRAKKSGEWGKETRRRTEEPSTATTIKKKMCFIITNLGGRERRDASSREKKKGGRPGYL